VQRETKHLLNGYYIMSTQSFLPGSSPLAVIYCAKAVGLFVIGGTVTVSLCAIQGVCVGGCVGSKTCYNGSQVLCTFILLSWVRLCRFSLRSWRGNTLACTTFLNFQKIFLCVATDL
jgi:hypothetical protein